MEFPCVWGRSEYIHVGANPMGPLILWKIERWNIGNWHHHFVTQLSQRLRAGPEYIPHSSGQNSVAYPSAVSDLGCIKVLSVCETWWFCVCGSTSPRSTQTSTQRETTPLSLPLSLYLSLASFHTKPIPPQPPLPLVLDCSSLIKFQSFDIESEP